MSASRACLSLFVACLIGTTGCSTMSAWRAVSSEPAGAFKKLRVTYRADSEQIKAACAAPPSEGQLVSYQEPATPLPDNTISTLEIVYPHPNGVPGMALVQVKIEARGQTENPAQPSSSAFKRFWNRTRDELPGLKGTGWTQERWVVDMPREDVERLVASLRSQGYFTKDKVATATTSLAATIDGTKTNKRWRQTRELDELITHVRTDGRLVSSAVPPKAGLGQDNPTLARLKKATTLQAYRDLLSRDAVRGRPADTPAEPEVVRLPDVSETVKR
ncbi:MAG: hypothetical protein AB7O62_12210 [Pirellulales bacterium]